MHKVCDTCLASMLILARQLVIGRNFVVEFYKVCRQEYIIASFFIAEGEEAHLVEL